ncbi:tryptophan synthase beta subunit-like PLP-dependent enzyme [Myxozyma melibiosi]|uniref:Tryptophan synthase beta subunit-like PLP-dependent enzyme n=1 Tax=Myxozyma melibiosi TaxID=54550 RepID=A0ABR1FCJ7_9ASCO
MPTNPPPVLDLSYKGVEEAYELIKEKVKKTPVLTSESISKIADESGRTRLFFKCENFQKGGAFKIRGATHALERLSPQQLQAGVITHSSGNHAQALSIAAQAKGVPAYIIMPSNSARPKIEATKSYGGKIYFSDPSASAREALTASIQSQTGATLVPPYDHPAIILGQGTAFLELVSQAAEEDGVELDAVIAPVGGGGLLAGTALAAQGGGGSRVRVFAGEPADADDCYRGLASGERVPVSATTTVADGLRTPVGVTNFGVIQKHVDAVFTVSEEEILRAMRLIWERMKIVVEPSAAVPLAVVLSERWKAEGVKGNVGLILSGGNVDLDKAGELLMGKVPAV